MAFLLVRTTSSYGLLIIHWDSHFIISRILSRERIVQVQQLLEKYQIQSENSRLCGLFRIYIAPFFTIHSKLTKQVVLTGFDLLFKWCWPNTNFVKKFFLKIYFFFIEYAHKQSVKCKGHISISPTRKSIFWKKHQNGPVNFFKKNLRNFSLLNLSVCIYFEGKITWCTDFCRVGGTFNKVDFPSSGFKNCCFRLKFCGWWRRSNSSNSDCR